VISTVTEGAIWSWRTIAKGSDRQGGPAALTVVGQPVADAGADQVVECSSPAGAPVTLDGSGSSDPASTPGTNDALIAFDWFEDYGLPSQVALGSGEVFQTNLRSARISSH